MSHHHYCLVSLVPFFLLTKLRFRRQCQEDAREGEKTIGPYSRADPSTPGGECKIASTARLDGQ